MEDQECQLQIKVMRKKLTHDYPKPENKKTGMIRPVRFM